MASENLVEKTTKRFFFDENSRESFSVALWTRASYVPSLVFGSLAGTMPPSISMLATHWLPRQLDRAFTTLSHHHRRTRVHDRGGSGCRQSLASADCQVTWHSDRADAVLRQHTRRSRGTAERMADARASTRHDYAIVIGGSSTVAARLAYAASPAASCYCRRRDW